MAAMLVIGVIILSFLSSSFSQVLHCDFDNTNKLDTVFPCTCNGGSCQLVQSLSDQFDWLAYSGTTPSSETGPDEDHTKGDDTGLYIYSEASDNNPGSNARISSPPLVLNEPACLFFWYHMKGEHIGALQVSFTYFNGTQSIVWEKTGEQGDAWIEDTKVLPTTVTMVTFSTVRGGSNIGMPYGDIALDDLMIQEGLCPGVTEPSIMPTDAVTTTTSTTTDPRPSTTAAPATSPPTSTTTTKPASTSMSLSTTQTPGQSTATFPPTSASSTPQSLPSVTTTEVSETVEVGVSSTHSMILSTMSTVMADTTISRDTGTMPGSSIQSSTRLVGMPSSSTSASSATSPSSTVNTISSSSTSTASVITSSSTNTADSSTTSPVTAPSDTLTTNPNTSGTTSPGKSEGCSDATLWGLDETLWIIILVVAGAVILILLVIVCVQACAMRRMRTARIVRQSDDYSNIEAYNTDRYPPGKPDNFIINAYDNEAMAAEDKTTHANGGGIH